MNRTTVLFSSIFIFLCGVSMVLLHQSTSYTVLSDESKQRYQEEVMKKQAALRHYLEEEQERDVLYPPFYFVANAQNDEEDVIIHTGEDVCNPYVIENVRSDATEIVIQLGPFKGDMDCGPTPLSPFEAVRLSNPDQKSYRVLLDDGKLGDKTIHPFDIVLQQTKTTHN